MMTSAAAPVRAFTSYSWSSPTHEAWVINLASRLREDGVDVILDKWDLKPGHDAYQFMETMVTDKTVTKVMMICDKTYTEKANSRTGGVGTESQIISPELYNAAATQEKYAALMTDEDENGEAHVPVFYKGRIYFDFRSADKFESAYEELLRWLVDKPQHIKPKLGTVPEAILQVAPTATATQSRARRAEESVREGRANAPGLLREYGDVLRTELRTLSPAEQKETPFDDAILAAATAMRPYLRQLTEVVATTIRFNDDPRVWDRILAIHEQLGTLMFRSPEMTRWHPHQFDAFKMIAHEAFLNSIALTLEEERFDLTLSALTRPYLVKENDGGNRPTTSDFTVFRQYIESLEHRKRRLKLNRISLEGDMLKDNHQDGSVPSFEAIMQADFVLYLRACQSSRTNNWYPYSLVWASNRFSPFPIFARAESRAYFSRIAPIFGLDSADKFKEFAAELNNGERGSRMFDYQGLPIAYLANIEHICTLD